MLNSEYAKILKRLNLTRSEFAGLIGASVHTVNARCCGRTRITAKAHLQILEIAVAHLLRMTISGPAPRMKHAREVPAEFESDSYPRSARSQRTSQTPHRGVKKFRPARPIAARTCAAPGCQLPVEALPGARLCPQHGQDAPFMGWRRFE